MYVADRHKKEFDYPIHCHDIMELNFVENAAGARRVVGDSSEVIGDCDLVLITSSDLEHVWEQHECRSDDIHEVTVQFCLNFEDEHMPFRRNPYMSIYQMMMRAKCGLAFRRPAIMTVYPRLVKLASIDDKFLMAHELIYILHELSKFDDAYELASSTFAKVDVSNESRRVMKIRLGHAARLLLDTADSVSEICWNCGFNTLSNFNRLFRKRKGCSPTEFREKYCKTKVIV